MDNWKKESSEWKCGYCGNVFNAFGIPGRCPKCGSTNASSLPYVEYDFAKIAERPLEVGLPYTPPNDRGKL